MLVDINKRSYEVNGNEFNTIIHNEYNNLVIRDGLGEMERICSLLGELKFANIDTLVIYNSNHGGYIPINVAHKYQDVYLLNVAEEHKENIAKNTSSHNIQNIQWVLPSILGGCVVFSEKAENLDMSFIVKYHPIIVAPTSAKILKTTIYKTVLELANSNLTVYVPHACNRIFYDTFKYYIQTVEDDEVLHYDNLINLCIMVKNGGDQFEQMLLDNMHLIDQWTILDTGSTDNTLEIIQKT
jgi:acetolactate synthase small subunit